MGHVDHGGVQFLMQLADLARICTRSLASRLESGSSIKKRPLRAQSPARAPHAGVARRKRPRLAFQVLTQAENLRRPVTRSSITSLAIFCIFRPNAMFRRPSYADTARSSGTPSRYCVFSRNVVHSFAVDQQIAAADSSSPAIMRSVVDLPQPDGPTIQ